ncbi:hypothetical protein O7599_00210 [Streptomyces sp. WMMC500]|uniref:hypothetical protein n=1 Tax=Streptomyces sp. WMMC500 TaxID=3015154 RepID=UPI00248A9CBD|nr:hypothetical protein [Streptomyces sp. WMMC500]WBB61020.1 hypothetical protein O7599_00210 [Streptomyces sp. WMMC500]
MAHAAASAVQGHGYGAGSSTDPETGRYLGHLAGSGFRGGECAGVPNAIGRKQPAEHIKVLDVV